MNEVTEILRLSAPAPRPQAIAFDGSLPWLGSVDRDRLYAMNPHVDRARGVALPEAWGMTVVGDERADSRPGRGDHRTIYRRLGHGSTSPGDSASDDTGSHLPTTATGST